jgi:hypothetical protein
MPGSLASSSYGARRGGTRISRKHAARPHTSTAGRTTPPCTDSMESATWHTHLLLPAEDVLPSSPPETPNTPSSPSLSLLVLVRFFVPNNKSSVPSWLENPKQRSTCLPDRRPSSFCPKKAFGQPNTIKPAFLFCGVIFFSVVRLIELIKNHGFSFQN